MKDDVAIKVENLSKCYQIYDQPRHRLMQMLCRGRKQFYREFWALKDVSFEVKKGETVGIIGRNGCGKSTLLQMICGTLNPTHGSIQTQGRIAALLELGSGFNPEFTGRENVYMNASVLGLSRHETDTRLNDICDFADIGDFIDQPVKAYSSGMLVRLAFAVAINTNPDILIIDEALSVGDELFQRKCFSRIETIRENGATILFVSHSGAQIVELCDMAILIDTGSLVTSGEPKHVISNYQRLLYTPKASREKVRNLIIQGESVQQQHHNSQPTIEGVITSAAAPEMHDAVSTKEGFDPYLIPLTTLDYESHGPIIDTPEITREDGHKVNCLLRGRRYNYRYDVIFNRSAKKVRFGMAIKTTTGLSLAGALSASGLSSSIQKIHQATTVSVTFTFSCNFNPGVYFMNAGVFGDKNGDEILLHRRSDVIAFRVLQEPNDLETEQVFIKPKVSISF